MLLMAHFILHGLWAISGFTYLVAAWLMLRALRASHSEVWESLGGPRIFRGGSIERTYALFKYVGSGAYKATLDPHVIARGHVARASLYLFVILFPVMACIRAYIKLH